MALTVYGIKNCDSMKKTFQWLEAKGVAYQFVDFLRKNHHQQMRLTLGLKVLVMR